jgi:putative ABC transport system substrate-binding protein
VGKRLAALQGELGKLGWVEGRNVTFETRWGAGDPERTQLAANELASLAPDLIIANGSSAMDAIQRATRTVPVLFVVVPDPIGAGYADSLAHPGAPSLGVEVTPLSVRSAAEIERAINTFARNGNGGLIVTGSALAVVHRDLIIALAAKNKLPAVYFADYYVAAGGLVSYGPNLVDQYRQAASYVDRILKGEKPADLPVQAPTKYETAINLKTAKALGLTIPATLLARADKVIE